MQSIALGQGAQEFAGSRFLKRHFPYTLSERMWKVLLEIFARAELNRQNTFATKGAPTQLQNPPARVSNPAKAGFFDCVGAN
jgi:hypothetical protein